MPLSLVSRIISIEVRIEFEDDNSTAINHEETIYFIGVL